MNLDFTVQNVLSDGNNDDGMLWHPFRIGFSSQMVETGFSDQEVSRQGYLLFFLGGQLFTEEVTFIKEEILFF